MSLVETIIALLILSLAVLVMAKITAVKMEETSSIDAQYAVNAVDAFFSDVYHDFHRSVSYSAIENAGAQTVMLQFDCPDGPILYEFNGVTKQMYRNGGVLFDCRTAIMRVTGNNVYISVRLPNEKVMEFDVFR